MSAVCCVSCVCRGGERKYQPSSASLVLKGVYSGDPHILSRIDIEPGQVE